MKTLLIETVSNGWIVRPFQPCTERPAIAVYTDLAALPADLPLLLNDAAAIKYFGEHAAPNFPVQKENPRLTVDGGAA